MNKSEKVANIIAFLTLLFGEDADSLIKVLDFSPDYIIEKFERYVLSSRVEHPWGMHPSLRSCCFQRYIDKWNLELNEEEEN